MAAIGTVIDGKYEVLTLIGRGGMSSVYLAMDKRLNKQWAIKEIPKNALDKNNEIVIQSSIAEANMMKKLDHPALPRIVDIIETGEVIYVIMDYIEGEQLKRIVDDFGAQPQELVIEWAKQLCDVLDYLHSRRPPIVHRDMKPANVILKPEGNIKLIDFGIAREFKEHNLADTVNLGTKGYAAPEQFGGKGQTDARTDIYGLGVTLYNLVTGLNPSEPPYEIYPIRQVNPALSSGLERIIIKCTKQNPDERYQTCAELMYALEHYEEIDDVYRARQKRKLLKFILAVSASLLCLLIGVLGMAGNSNKYTQLIQQAKSSYDYEERVDLLKKAMEFKPTAREAYDVLMETFRLDGSLDGTSFNADEGLKLRSQLNKGFEDIVNTNDDYAQLFFDVGKFYFYHYDYGLENVGSTDELQLSRMKNIVDLFERAYAFSFSSNKNLDNQSDLNKKIGIYKDVCIFNRDINFNQDDASDAGLYKPYWNNLNNLLKGITKDDEDIVKLIIFNLTLNAIEFHADRFKLDGISETDMRATFEDIKTETNKLETRPGKTEKLKNEIVSRFPGTEVEIVNAYNK